MSARGEGAGQPSTSAQGQPAAPAPQKRGRGRPRKQQQVSTPARRGHSAHPRRLCPGARDKLGDQNAGAQRSGRRKPAGQPRGVGGRETDSLTRECAVQAPGCLSPTAPGGGGSAALGSHPAGGGVARGAYRDFRYCAQPRSGAAWLEDRELLGSHRLKSIALSASFPTVQRACGGLGCAGGSGLGRLQA